MFERENSQGRKSQLLIIEPLLLNSKDTFILQVLVQDFELLSISGRIAGVKDIKQINSSLPSGNSIILSPGIPLFLAVLAIAYAVVPPPEVSSVSDLIEYSYELLKVAVLSTVGLSTAFIVFDLLLKQTSR